MTEPIPPDDASLVPAIPDAAALASDSKRLAAVLATVLDQQNRESSANRAQARELVRAVEGLAKAHEYLGKELAAERGRSRLLWAAVLAVPLVVAGLLVWSGKSGDEELARLRDDVARDIQDVRDKDAAREKEAARTAAQAAATRSEFEGRLEQASKDADSLRTDLDAARSELAGERRTREAKETEQAARIADADRERSELTALRAEAGALREIAGAERARADDLARAFAAAAKANREAEGGVKTASPPATADADAPPPPAKPRDEALPPREGEGRRPEAPGPGAAGEGARAPGSAASSAPEARDAPADTAVRDPGDLERIRTKINGLLEGATGAARYLVETLSGVTGTDLLGVRVVGRDANGRVLRTVEADHLEISVLADGGVRLRFTDGHLLVGDRRAPFFDGAYTLALGGSAEPWRNAGLSCVKLP
jgi:hypothetical protein